MMKVDIDIIMAIIEGLLPLLLVAGVLVAVLCLLWGLPMVMVKVSLSVSALALAFLVLS